MHGEDFFLAAFVYLAAAVISVPIAKRLGLGSVIGYLAAGVGIGPFALKLVGDSGDVMHFAEFGVVMMLFLVGLELDPKKLWRMRKPLLGLGGLQVAVTAAVLAGLGLALGLVWQVALAVGLTLSLSSTAIVLQTLQEKGLSQTRAGHRAFATLLFQDVSVIPMLALFPLLATLPRASETDEALSATAWMTELPAWSQTLIVMSAVATVVMIGRYLVRPAFRAIARVRMRELLTAGALLLIIGIALLMAGVGLNPALGTFLAGVVLANSEFRHELEAEIEPFKGLLLGLFFISVGASIDFALIAAQPATIFGIVVLLIAVKFAVLVGLGRMFGLSLDQNLLYAFLLSQSGEFAFVLFSFAAKEGVVERELTAPLIAAVAVSMALTPLMLVAFEHWIAPKIGTRERISREPDSVDESSPVIIAGFGRFGHIIGRLLVGNGIRPTVLEHDSDQVEFLRRLGLDVFYGDASRTDLLEAAGAGSAKVLVLATDDPAKRLEIVRSVRKRWPHLTILCRAKGRADAYELLDAGVEHVYRETLDTSLRVGVDVLRKLGARAYQAERSARKLRRFDEAAIRQMAATRHDRLLYIDRAREAIRQVEKLLRAELGHPDEERDAAWDNSTLRRDRDLTADSTASNPEETKA